MWFEMYIRQFSIAILEIMKFTSVVTSPVQDRSKLDNWGGGVIFIYSGSVQLISFETN